MPGLLVLTVAARAFANCPASVFQATNEGYAEDVLTSALRPWQLALSYMSGGLLHGLVAVLTVALVPLPGAQDREGAVWRPLLVGRVSFSLMRR